MKREETCEEERKGNQSEGHRESQQCQVATKHEYAMKQNTKNIPAESTV